MRTTLFLDDALLEQARERAAGTGQTLSQVVEDAPRRSFARQRPTGSASDDSAGLLELMERGAPRR